MNIYVGNLNYRVDESALESAFAEFGTVSSVKIISDKYNGRSKGFGFVTMDDDAEAKNAIEKLNGTMMEDREMVVNEARPKRNEFNRY
jgi:RNA recognition motif-containing protein